MQERIDPARDLRAREVTFERSKIAHEAGQLSQASCGDSSFLPDRRHEPFLFGSRFARPALRSASDVGIEAASSFIRLDVFGLRSTLPASDATRAESVAGQDKQTSSVACPGDDGQSSSALPCEEEP